MEVINLDRKSFRHKVSKSYESYLNIDENYRLAIGIYYKGNYYVFGNGIEAESFYDIGSISKTMTAHIILDLVNQGLVDLNKTVDNYIDLKKGVYPTIYELLTHTAGYGNLTPVEITVPSLFKWGYARKNIYKDCDLQKVKRALERRNKHKKVNKYGYSDFAFAILAIVASNVCGKEFSTLMQDFISDKLKLVNTHVIFDKNRYPLAANNGKIFPFWKWNACNPYIASGGVTSNIYDMLSYVKIQIESELEFITKAHVVCENSFSKRNNILTCFGWHTYQKSNQLWHVGGVGTFRSSIIFNKVKKYGVVVLGNAKGIAGANVHYLAKMLYSELKINKISI